MELPGALFSPSWKNKQNAPRENFLCPNIKNFIYIFSAALIFQETEPPQKKFLCCLKRKLFLYFGKRKPPKKYLCSGNGTFLYFMKRNFPNSKKKQPTLKKCLKFREIELSSSKLKKILIFQERTCKIRRKTNKKIRSEEPFNISPKKVFLTSRCWLSRKMKIFWLQDDYFS